ncbi:MAG: GntR family transcriptional regulator [Pseudomonadota bacterium]
MAADAGLADRQGGLADLSPVASTTLHESVYQVLRGQLMRGGFAAGEVLKIQSVAAQLETSTMPVREALVRLIGERALEAMPNRSVRVPLISRARLDDLAGTRAVVEGEALRRAIPSIASAELKVLASLTDKYDAALRKGSGSSAAKAADLNHAFHAHLYAASGSPVLLSIIESLWLQSGPYVRAAADVYREDDGIAATHHHRAILTAISARDTGAAVAALAADIDFAFALLRKRLPDPATPGAEL